MVKVRVKYFAFDPFGNSGLRMEFGGGGGSTTPGVDEILELGGGEWKRDLGNS